MILDFFSNLKRYTTLPHLQEIERYVTSRDCCTIPDGEHEILGRDLFVRVAEYKTGTPLEKQFEAHTVYADLQYVVSGAEIMECSLEKQPTAVTSYHKEADIQFFESPKEISCKLVAAGQFTVFFPGELHKPGCWVESKPAKVKKLVFKIKMPADA